MFATLSLCVYEDVCNVGAWIRIKFYGFAVYSFTPIHASRDLKRPPCPKYPISPRREFSTGHRPGICCARNNVLKEVARAPRARHVNSRVPSVHVHRQIRYGTPTGCVTMSEVCALILWQLVKYKRRWDATREAALSPAGNPRRSVVAGVRTGSR